MTYRSVVIIGEGRELIEVECKVQAKGGRAVGDFARDGWGNQCWLWEEKRAVLGRSR